MHRICLYRLFLAGCFSAILLALSAPLPLQAQARFVQTPYQNPKALIDIYLDDPAKLAAALNWVRGVMNPLTQAPYSLAPDDIPIIVLMHGMEVVTLARKNEERYRDLVQRMRYYAELGVKFKVCGLSIRDYGYAAADLYDFVEITPSALTELVHWQNRGYALVPATVMDKKFSIEDIR
ncbi:MAG: DsrE family protein [Hylemonella sp.]|nr:DsrE family protein [Hylemonella sp.]